MTLSERLETPQQPDARRPRTSHPTGMEPGIRYEAGEAAEVTVTLREIPENEQQWREQIKRTTTLDIPDHRKVELTQVRTWGEPGAENVYCRFIISDRPEDRPEVNAVALLKQLRPRKAVKTAFTGDTTLGMTWCDWQAGKIEGGGTAALVERLDAAFDGVRDRARELRKTGRDLGHALIVGAGDMIEGCSIFPNQSYSLDTDRRGQIRNVVALGLEGLDRIAPLFERVTVLVVGGNHGENRVRAHGCCCRARSAPSARELRDRAG